MKKILLIAIGVASGGMMIAQQAALAPQLLVKEAKFTTSPSTSSRTTATFQGRISPSAVGITKSKGKVQAYYINTFQDSSVVAVASVGGNPTPQYVFCQKVAAVLDPHSKDPLIRKIFQSDSVAYSVDTVWVAGNYERNSASSVVDTLKMELVYSDTVALVPAFTAVQTITAPKQNYAAINYKGDKRNGNYGGVTFSNKIVVKMPLTEADSTPSGTSYVYTPFPVVVNGTKGLKLPGRALVGAAFTFIPGYTYKAKDTIFFDTKKSKFDNYRPYLLQSTAPGGTTNSSFYDTSSYCGSQLLLTATRYSKATGIGNTILNPNANIGFLIDFSVSGTISAGINDRKFTGGSLEQNVPNPFNRTTSIPYALSTGSKVSLEIFDVTGRKVTEMNEGQQSAGNHSVTVEASKFQKGIYFYSLKVNGITAGTKKMIISE